MGITIQNVGDLDYQPGMIFSRLLKGQLDFAQTIRVRQEGANAHMHSQQVEDWMAAVTELPVLLTIRPVALSPALTAFLEEYGMLMRVTYLPEGTILQPSAADYDQVSQLHSLFRATFDEEGKREANKSAKEIFSKTGLLHLELPDRLRSGLRRIAMEQITDVHLDVYLKQIDIQFKISEDIPRPVDYLMHLATTLGAVAKD